MRRTRQAPWIRDLVREAVLLPADLILPTFVIEGQGQREPISHMPGVERLSIDLIVEQARCARSLGIPAIALFPAVEDRLKSDDGAEAFNPDSLICRTVSAIKAAVPGIGVICDVALDPYTTHGHDGVVEDGEVKNDATVEVLARQALTLAEAGCDVVAPSDMMDGRVSAIRTALEANGFFNTLILSYAAKYASCFYGPFRGAVGSSQALGGADKATYQMDLGNSREAIREAALDVSEGADMVMIKPGMPYLDILLDAARNLELPVFAYQVSGEYAMLSLAAEQGLFDKNAAIREALLAFKRAGARGIFSYAAMEVAEKIREVA